MFLSILATKKVVLKFLKILDLLKLEQGMCFIKANTTNESLGYINNLQLPPKA